MHCPSPLLKTVDHTRRSADIPDPRVLGPSDRSCIVPPLLRTELGQRMMLARQDLNGPNGEFSKMDGWMDAGVVCLRNMMAEERYESSFDSCRAFS